MKPNPPRVTPIKNAYQNVEKACREKLAEIYPAGIPPFAQERLELELSYISIYTSMQDDLEIHRRISAEILRAGSFLFPRGPAAGSFLYYLLGNVSFNPLPAHYYCKECGHFELTDGKLFGIDLPQRTCPRCKSPMIADGFNISPEMLYGLNAERSFAPDYNVDAEIQPFFRKVLSDVYPGHRVESLCTAVVPGPEPTPVYRHAGFAVLPPECTIEDYPELASYMENGEPCIRYDFIAIEQAGIKKINCLPNLAVRMLVQLQRATGRFIGDITLDELRRIRWNDLANTGIFQPYAEMIIRDLKPKSFTEMTRIEAACHNTTVIQQRQRITDDYDYLEIENFLRSEDMKKYQCCTRDDFFDAFLSLGTPKEAAYKLTYATWTGNACKNRKGRWSDLMQEITIPEDLRRICEQYLYAFPRCHAAIYILCDAMLAHYMLMDSKAYSKVAKETHTDM